MSCAKTAHNRRTSTFVAHFGFVVPPGLCELQIVAGLLPLAHMTRSRVTMRWEAGIHPPELIQASAVQRFLRWSDDPVSNLQTFAHIAINGDDWPAVQFQRFLMASILNETLKFCSQCGQPVCLTAHFCSHCGSSLETPTARQPDQSEPQSAEIQKVVYAGPGEQTAAVKSHHREPGKRATPRTSNPVAAHSKRAAPRLYHGIRLALAAALVIAVGLLGLTYIPELIRLLRSNPVNPITDADGTAEQQPLPELKIIFTSGPPLKELPPETMEHMEGGVISLPARLVSDLGTVSWEPVERPRELTGLPLTGPVMKFDNQDSLTILGKTTIDVPLGQTKQGAVLVQGAMGLWVPLPATPVTLPNGTRGLRIEIDGEPAPWLVAVTSRPDIAETITDPLMKEMLQLEQQLWTHKQAIRTPDVSQVMPADTGPLSLLGPRAAYAQEPSLLTPEDQARQIYKTAWWKFRELSHTIGDKVYVEQQLMRGSNPLRDVWPIYCEAVDLLLKLQAMPKDVLERARFTSPVWFVFGAEPPGGVEVSPDLEKLWKDTDQVSVWKLMQKMAEEYTPWGADFVSHLIKAGRHRDGAAVFDLRVLAPLGELKFVDVNFPGQLPLSTEIEKAIQNTVLKQKYLSDKATLERRTIRLFSTRTVNWNLYAWSLNFSDDVLLRWGPVLYGGVQFIGMAGSTTMTGGMSLLGAFAWAYYQEAKDAYNTCLDVGGEIYIRTEYVNTATGDSLVPLRDVLAHYQGGRLKVGELDFRANLRDLRSDIVQLMFSGGVAWLQQEADLGFLKEVSNIPTGFQGYNGANLPPVLVYVMMWGPLKEAADKDHYPTTLAASLGYTLDFGPISQSFPGDRLPKDLGDEQRAEGIRSLPWKRYRPNQPWPTLLQSISPDEQLLRFGISEEVIRRRMADLAIDEDWQSVSLDKLELYVSVRSRDQRIQILTPVTEVTLPEDKAKNLRYGAIRLHGEGKPFIPIGFVGVPEPYRGSVHQIDKTRVNYEVLLAAIPADSPQRTANPLTRPVLAEVMVKKTEPTAQQHRAKLVHFNPDKPPEQLWYLLDMGELPAAEPPVQLIVTPNDLRTARLEKTYRIQTRASGISPRIQRVKVTYNYPDGSRKEFSKSPTAGVVAVQDDKQFTQSVTGTLRVELQDEKSLIRLARAEVPVVVRSESRPQIFYTEKPEVPFALMPPMTEGTPTNPIASVSRFEKPRELYFQQLRIPRTSPHGDDPVYWDRLRLEYKGDGTIDYPGSEDSPSFNGKVEDYRVTLTIKVPAGKPYEIGTQKYPGTPAVEKTWVFDKW
jgi:hypothetical protein